MYKTRRLTQKEEFDIRTMQFFIPSTIKIRIYPNDKVKMADLSSKGTWPKRITTGFVLLKWGKTYRDEQITSYRRDISEGLVTKAEIVDSYPIDLKDWVWGKIEDVPYDVHGETAKYFIKIREHDTRKVGE